MFAREDKENESSQDNDRTGKLLVAEPSGQKPRRSVLKEFDPFAPESPCPVTQKIKSKIEEEELFEDAETSLTSFICKNSETKPKSPKNVSTSNREILLIPDLMENCSDIVKLNDTADLSYKEALESHSLSTDSSEDVEFKPKSTENRGVVFVENNFQNDVLPNGTQVLNDMNKINDADIKQNSINTINHNVNTALYDGTVEPYSNQYEIPAQENIADFIENNCAFQQLKNPLEQSDSSNAISIVEDTQILNNCNTISENLNQTFEKPDKNTGEMYTNEVCDKSSGLVQNETSPESSTKFTEALSVGVDLVSNNVDKTFISEELNEVNQQAMEADSNTSTEKPSFTNPSTNLSESKSLALENVKSQNVENCSKEKNINAKSLCSDKTGDILPAYYKDEIVELLGKCSLNADDNKETEETGSMIPQSNCSITKNVENEAVSLQDILNVDTSLIQHHLPSTKSNLPTEDQAVVPEKLVEALAQSFNHTIDIVESATVDSVNSSTSPNTSSGLVNKDLNVTVDLPTKDNESIKSDENSAERVEENLDISKDLQSLTSSSEKADSNSFANLSKQCNISLPAEDQAADPEKLVEALAQSFNHTIDIEKSANISSGLVNRDLNVTVDLPTKDNEIVKSDEKNAERVEGILENCKDLKRQSLTSSSQKADSNSFANISNKCNISLTTEDQAADPEKLLEALAQSFNHTIDIEESAIVDYGNSFTTPNTSGGLENEDLNVTIDLPNKDNESVKSEEKGAELVEGNLEKGKDLQRQSLTCFGNEETDKPSKELVPQMKPNDIVCQNNLELEDFEEKCKANVLKKSKEQITEDRSKNNDLKGESSKESSNDTKTQNSEEPDESKFSEEIRAQEVISNSNKVYQRQDTQEFEDLEQQCTRNSSVQHSSIDTSHVKVSNTEMDVIKSSIEIVAQAEPDPLNTTNSKETNEIKASEETVAQEVEPNNSKVYQRQDTQEFEDFEQQCQGNFSGQYFSIDTSYVKTTPSNKTMDVTKLSQLEQDSSNIPSDGKTPFNSKETRAQEVKPNYYKVYHRQDTQEFEDLEKRCKRNVLKQQNSLINTSFIITSSSEEIDATKSCEEIIPQEVEQDCLKETDATQCNKEKAFQEVELNSTKVYQRQDTQEFEDIEQRCKIPSSDQDFARYNTQECNHLNQTFNTHETESIKAVCGSQLGIETVQNLKTEEESKKQSTKQCADHVKIRVSGNFCNAVSENCYPTEDVVTNVVIQENYNLSPKEAYQTRRSNDAVLYTNENEDAKKLNKVTIETVGTTIKSNSENDDPCTTKTKLNSDLDQANRHTIAHISTSKVINKNYNLIAQKTEARRRNDAFIANENDHATNENRKLNKGMVRPECRASTRTMRDKTQDIEAKYVDGQLEEYQTKSNEMKNEMDALKIEIDSLKKDNMKKDKLILTCALDIEVERCTVERYKKAVDEYERVIKSQCEKLNKLKEESDKNAKQFTAFEMAFADVFEKYQKTKGIIELYKKNEEILQSNLQNADDQMTKLQAKCDYMKEQYNEQIKKAEEQLAFEKEKYKQELSKLETIVKRLEIKSSSLETSLKQKTEECRALAALCDDITGKPM